MSIIEALAAGVPVLISEACNMPEVQLRDAGRIVEPHRGAIAAGIKELVTMTDEQRRAIGRCGRELARSSFDWELLIPKYQEMYKNAMAAPAIR